MSNKNTKSTKAVKKSRQASRKEPFFSKPVLIICFILAVLVVATFFRTLGYQFVYLDDNFLITGWFKGATMNIQNFFEVFRRSIGDSFYRPVLALTVVWDEGLGGIQPYHYHLTNMILYILSSVLIYLFLVRLKINNILAASLSILFVVHPVNAPAIAWIFGRNEPLLAIFFLSSLIFLITSYNESNQAKRYLYIALHLILYFFGLYSKETALIIPGIFVAFTYLFYKDKIKNWEFGFLVFFWGALAFIWFLSRQSVLGDYHSTDVIGLEALAKNWKAFFAIIGKIFIPQSLALNSYYDNLSVYGGMFFFAVLSVLSVYPKGNVRKKIFGFIWFVLFLLPPLFIISKVDFDYAEHRAFLPMIGLLLLIANLIESFNIDYKKYSFRIPVIALFLFLFIRTQIYLPVFENHSSFWSNLPKTYPERQIAYAIAGGVLFNEKFRDESIKLLMEGENAPIKNSTLYNNIATIHLAANNPDKAEYYAQKGLAIDSVSPRLVSKLAMAKLKKGDTTGALSTYEKALRIDSLNVEALANISMIYMRKKDYDKAIKFLEKATQRDKSNAVNFNNLGVCYYNSGNFNKAEEIWLFARQNTKLNIDAYNNLIMLNIGKDKAKAIKFANELMSRGGRLKPEYRRALFGN